MLPTKKTVAIAIALTLSVPALTSSALAQTKAEKPAAKAAATPKVEGKVSVNGVIIPQAFFDAMNATPSYANLTITGGFFNSAAISSITISTISGAGTLSGSVLLYGVK